jgi:hypothetical protein
MAQASYPAELLYHPEHDWARIDADDPTLATLGITWYAQDSLGEVVFFEATPRSSRSRPSPTSSRRSPARSSRSTRPSPRTPG